LDFEQPFKRGQRRKNVSEHTNEKLNAVTPRRVRRSSAAKQLATHLWLTPKVWHTEE